MGRRGWLPLALFCTLNLSVVWEMTVRGRSMKGGNVNIEELDLSNLSKQQLQTLQRRIDRELKTFDERRKAETLAELERIAQERGFSLAEVVEGRRPSKRIHPPKYRNPKGDETWGGRGRKPEWFKEAIASGMSEDDMLIDRQ